MRLPSTRELARRCGLSRGTVVAAFEQLHSEGYVEGEVGSGTRVNTLLPEDLLHAKPTPARVGGAKKSQPLLSLCTLWVGPVSARSGVVKVLATP